MATISERIVVYARIRPLLACEGETRGVHNDAAKPRELTVTDSALIAESERRWRFERVFGERATQSEVFECSCMPLVEAVLRGANASCITYGQTGTGKTHTMLGHDLWALAAEAVDAAGQDDDEAMQLAMSDRGARGIIPRCVACLFGTMRKAKVTSLRTKVTYLEIYNERVIDLLAPSSSNDEESTNDGAAAAQAKGSLEIRDDTRRGIVAMGAEEVEVNSEEEILDVLWWGARRRAMSATDLNERSSRSHTILTIVFEKDGASYSKLNLVDLAGSEKWRSYELKQFSQKRIKELTSINGSLSALAKCVSALLRGQKHVPYRDSKLTRLLQDSLGGTCRTTFVVTMSPGLDALDETLSTLDFARRAMHVKSYAAAAMAPNVGETRDVTADLRIELAKAKSEIARLQGLLDRRAAKDSPNGAAKKDSPNNHLAAKNRHAAYVQTLAEEWHRVSEQPASSVEQTRWLRKYGEWLKKAEVTPADLRCLSLRDRVALMEASVRVQSEELRTTKTDFEKERRRLKKERDDAKQQYDGNSVASKQHYDGNSVAGGSFDFESASVSSASTAQGSRARSTTRATPRATPATNTAAFRRPTSRPAPLVRTSVTPAPHFSRRGHSAQPTTRLPREEEEEQAWEMKTPSSVSTRRRRRRTTEKPSSESSPQQLDDDVQAILSSVGASPAELRLASQYVASPKSRTKRDKQQQPEEEATIKKTERRKKSPAQNGERTTKKPQRAAGGSTKSSKSKKERPIVERHLDASTGVYYYHNRQTNTTTWDPPPEYVEKTSTKSR